MRACLAEANSRTVDAMHGQVDDHGEPRFTLEQIAAAMSGAVTAVTIHNYAPARRRPFGLGGDARALKPEQIAEMRALRAETTPAGKFRYTLQELADRFGVTNVTASRHCLDIQPGDPVTPRGGGGKHTTRKATRSPADATISIRIASNAGLLELGNSLKRWSAAARISADCAR